MTTISIKGDEDSVVRATQEDGLDTWFGLTELFFQMLSGMGYHLPASPEQLVEILEDFHGKCMEVKYPREREPVVKCINTPEQVSAIRDSMGHLMLNTEILIDLYNGHRNTYHGLRFDRDVLITAEGKKIDLYDIASWKAV